MLLGSCSDPRAVMAGCRPSDLMKTQTSGICLCAAGDRLLRAIPRASPGPGQRRGSALHEQRRLQVPWCAPPCRAHSSI